MKKQKLIHLLLIFSGVLLFVNCNKEGTAANTTGAGGSTARFTTSGNYLYVVDHSSLKAFHIANPHAPVYQSKTEVGINVETIFPYEDKLFIGSSSAMYIYSLQNPDKPSFVARADYIIRMACDPVVVKDSTAYATLRASGQCGGAQSALVVYNIKNIAQPLLTKTVNLTAPYGLGVSRHALYVCEGTEGLRVFDVSQPYDPVQTGSITNDTFYDVIPYGNILIGQTANGFALYDIGTDPLQPVLLSRIQN